MTLLVLASENTSDANETTDDDKDDTMSSSTATTKKTKKKSSGHKKTGAADADGQLKSPPVPVSFNLFACDAYEKTEYVWDGKDIIELEIFVNGCIPNHAYLAELSPDKRTFFWKRGTPKSVFCPERLEQSMDAGTYNPNHTRVAAHGDIHQMVLASNPESKKGWYFCKSPVSIDLGAQVVGDPTVFCSRYQVCEFEGHAQFNTIYSFVMEKASQRIQAKKKATQTQILTLAFDDDDDDDEDGVGRGPSCAAARRGQPVQQLPFMQPRDGAGAKGKGGKGGGSRRSITTTKAALPSQTMTSMAKRPVSFSNSDGSGSSSSGDSSGSEDDDDSDLDVKPLAKSVKREVKSEVKSKAAACIELDSDDE